MGVMVVSGTAEISAFGDFSSGDGVSLDPVTKNEAKTIPLKTAMPKISIRGKRGRSVASNGGVIASSSGGGICGSIDFDNEGR